MASNVHKKIESLETTMYHHGLVKILVEYHLKKIGDTWENFLIRNHFQETPESPENDSVRKSRRKKINLTFQSNPEPPVQKNDGKESISEKLTEIRKQIKQRKKIKQQAGGITENTPESPLQPDDEQPISEKLIEIKRQIKGKGKIGKEKKGVKEENIKPLRRSSRLRGMVKKVSSKETDFINLEGETPVSSPENIPFRYRPQNFARQYFEGIPSRGSPGIDPIQHQIYDYIESLEKRNASRDPGSSANPKRPINPQELLTDSPKQEIYELEKLNKHIKK